MDRYLRRHPDLEAGLSVQDDWPHEPYLLLRVTGDPRRLSPVLRRLARFPYSLRLRHVTHSTRELTRIQDRISDDFDALAADGLYVSAVGVDSGRNDVSVELITARTDAAAAFRARYGPLVRVQVIATSLTSPACADLAGYRPGPQPDTVLVAYQAGGGATFDQAVVTETPEQVTVAIVVQRYNGVTTADSVIREQPITLTAPLGSRAVIDLATGKRLAVWRDPFGP